MSIKAKLHLFTFWVLPLLFLSFGLPSLGYEVPYPKTEQERCVEQCRESEKDFSGLLACSNCSERKYGHRESSSDGEDPKSPRWEIERCQHRCQTQETDQKQLKKCQQRCEDEAIKKREREQQRGQERQPREHEREREEREEPPQEYERCHQICEERQQPRLRPECERRCQREYEERKRSEERGKPESRESRRSREMNPYYFHSQRLQSRFKTEEGHIRVLQTFTDRSQLLRGIENFRLSTLEANPNTFVVPHHCDAESIIIVLSGKGTISYAVEEKRESYSLETGDVIRIPAGATVYLINHDNTEKLSIAKLIIPVHVPGEFREYFAAGGENPESFYRAFSKDVLEAALNTPRDELERLFGQQRQGMILKAPQQQLKALSQRVSSAKQKGHDIRGPFNLLNQQPLYSNRHGKFIEASPNDRKQLQDIDISVFLSEIKRGALMVPHFNSKAPAIVLVVQGSGRFEMACPHLARETQESQARREQRGEETESSGQYEKISSSLSPGDVFIIPAGHPVAIVASQNENLVTVGFEVNASDNQRNFLAGRNNIMNQIEKEAKELSFNAPAESIDKIFRNQKESHFVAGPQQGQQGIPSILEFAGFFY